MRMPPNGAGWLQHSPREAGRATHTPAGHNTAEIQVGVVQ